jgi:hypothetical protein
VEGERRRRNKLVTNRNAPYTGFANVSEGSMILKDGISTSALVEANAEKYISYFEWILNESELALCRSPFRTKWKSISMLYRREMGMSIPPITPGGVDLAWLWMHTANGEGTGRAARYVTGNAVGCLFADAL